MEFLSSSAGKTLMVALPTISFTFMAFMPSALQLYFVATGFFALVQAYLVNSTAFRNMLGMTIARRYAIDTSAEETQSHLARLQSRVNARMKPSESEAQKDTPLPSKQNVSKIDKLMGGVGKHFRQSGTDISQKLTEMSGKGPATNADGSPAAPPRLTAAERKKAEEYEQEQQSLDDYRRSERNHARRSAQMRALRVERQKASAAFQRQQEAARQNKPDGRK